MKRDNTKIIDQYLSGELSEEDKIKFEEELNANPELLEEFELQQNINEAAKRSSIRNTVKSVGKKYHAFQLTKWIVGGIAIIALTGSAIYFSTQSEKKETEEQIESSTKVEDKLKNDELIKELPREVFSWSGEDTVYFSESGVLISVPNEALLQNGKPYKGKAIIEWQEAIDGARIMKCGLSTMADSNMLETQGMFSFRVTTEDGELLDVDEEVGIYVQVPVDEIKPGMELYEGVYDKDSIINWVDPKPLEKLPVPVDMSELDFYPEGYEDTLNKLKLSQRKEFRDSLYLACEVFEMEGNNKYMDTAIRKGINPVNAPFINDNRSEDLEEEEAVSVAEDVAIKRYNFIPPSKVLAFRNKKFNNTILATREFERRMKTIHETCDESLLDLYVNNLNRPMYYLDSIAIKKGYNSFRSYYAERIGKVETDNAHLESLKEFYQNGLESLRDDLKKQRENYDAQNKKFDEKLAKERVEQAIRTSQMNDATLNQETRLNLKQKTINSGAAQAFPVSSTALITSRQMTRSIGFRINRNNSIKNVDRKVADATRSRRNFQGEYGGKKINVKYNDFSIELENPQNYVRLYTYLLPNKFNSYQRLNGTNGIFSYRLNDEIRYNVVILGFNEGGFYYHEIQNINNGQYSDIELNPISEDEFENRISQLNNSRLGNPSTIHKDLQWLKLEQENYRVQKSRMSKLKLLERMRPVVFPCCCQEAESNQNEEPILESFNIPGEIVDYPALEPQFPGGAASMKRFLAENITYPEKAMNEGAQGKVFVEFIVEADGSISNVRIVRGVSPEIDNEAIRVVRSMPNWTPAQNGGNVRSINRIPINFTLTQ